MIWASELEFHKELLEYIDNITKEREAGGGSARLVDFLHEEVLRRFANGDYCLTDIARRGDKVYCEFSLKTEGEEGKKE